VSHTKDAQTGKTIASPLWEPAVLSVQPAIDYGELCMCQAHAFRLRLKQTELWRAGRIIGEPGKRLQPPLLPPDPLAFKP
jgi:hypothetical protein